MGYFCSVCNEEHEDLPDVVSDRPVYWWDVPAEEVDRRIRLTPETCIIDDEAFFIRGVLQIPIHDYPHPLGFGVWVSQSRPNFYTYLANFDTDKIGPFFGWLSTRLSVYGPDTLQIKTMAHFLGNNQRPLIQVEPTDHPLSVDQRNGITLERAWEIVHACVDSGSV